jgi:uncharacterized protein (UPF0305 family)
MSDVAFSLPDDLGFECNDEVSKYVDAWLKDVTNNVMGLNQEGRHMVWQVAKAELMDNIYSIIKRYQENGTPIPTKVVE